MYLGIVVTSITLSPAFSLVMFFNCNIFEDSPIWNSTECNIRSRFETRAIEIFTDVSSLLAHIDRRFLLFFALIENRMIKKYKIE